MSEAVSFWLDNKKVSGLTVVEINDQTLVDYRGKFYVIKNGAAVMKGSKPQHFSKTSLPLVWKKALRGELVSVSLPENFDETLPIASIKKPIRPKKEKEIDMVETIASESTMLPPPTPGRGVTPKAALKVKKSDSKVELQLTVPAKCPYCNYKQELPVEKGKNGKPFFALCPKCSTDFAVRFVPVTIFQAQVAGFN